MPQSSLSPTLQITLNKVMSLVNTDRYAALNQCELGFAQARAAQDDFAFIAIAIQYGLVIDQIGFPDTSIDTLNEALQLAHQLQRPQDEACLLNVIGRAEYTRAAYHKAMTAWAQCLIVATFANDPITWVWAKVGLAQIYDAYQDHATAVNLLEQAKIRAQKLDAPILNMNIHLNLGVNLFHIQAYEQALHAYQQGLVIARQLNHLDDLGELLFRIAEIALVEGRISAALATLDEAQGICMEANHIWGLANIHAIRAQALAQKEVLDQALEEIKMGIDYASAAGAVHIEMRLLQIQAELAERQYEARKKRLKRIVGTLQLEKNDVRLVGGAVLYLQLHELEMELDSLYIDVNLAKSSLHAANRLRLKVLSIQQPLAELDILSDQQHDDELQIHSFSIDDLPNSGN